MTRSEPVSRREALRMGVGAGVGLSLARAGALHALLSEESPVLKRAIPSSGERLTVVGIGTRDFGTGYNAEARAALKEMLKRFPELGGQVIDTAPSYRDAETIIGELTGELGIRPKLFLANKVNAGRAANVAAEVKSQFETGLARLKTDKLDLLQVHNLAEVPASLELLRDWKREGRIRYLGITTSDERQYEQMATHMRAQPLDFVQLDYAINNREAADVILPLAKDRGMAVLINLPFGRTSAFTKTTGKPLPGWAKDIGCTTWPQVLLKYVVSHPAVTVAIPGTRKVEHIVDNMTASRGELPDEPFRKRIEQAYDAL